MNTYYLDEPFGEDDFTFVKKFIVGKGGLSKIQSMKQIRVPTVLPAQSTIVGSDELDKQIGSLIGSLKKTGLDKGVGNA